MRKHYVVTAYTFTKDFRNILLVWHNKLLAWVPPGGHINENETPLEAAVRELKEETGVQAKFIDLNNQLVINKEEISKDNYYEILRPFSLLIEIIEKGNEEEHIHIDNIYVMIFEDDIINLTNHQNDNENVKWLPVSELCNIKTMPNVINVVIIF